MSLFFEIFSFKNQVGSNKKFKGASNNNEIIAAENTHLHLCQRTRDIRDKNVGKKKKLEGKIMILLKCCSHTKTRGIGIRLKLIAFPDDKPLTSELNGSL